MFIAASYTCLTPHFGTTVIEPAALVGDLLAPEGRHVYRNRTQDEISSVGAPCIEHAAPLGFVLFCNSPARNMALRWSFPHAHPTTDRK